MRFRAYRTTSDNKIYFQFLSTNEEERFNSIPYDDRNACFDGIRSVLQVAADENRYRLEEDDAGHHYFNLYDADGQLLGRSIAYDTAEAAHQSMEAFQQNAPFATSKPTATEEAPASAPAEPAETSEQEVETADDSPSFDVGFFEQQTGTTDFGTVSFHYPDRGYFFAFKQEGEVVLMSVPFATEAARDQALDTFHQLRPDDQNYDRSEAKDQFFFSLHDGDRLLAQSAPFTSELVRETIIEQLINLNATKLEAPVLEEPPADEGYPPCDQIPKQEGLLTFEGGTPLGYYFAFNHPEGRTVLRGKPEASTEAREASMQKVIAMAGSGKNYAVVGPADDELYITVKGEDEEELARSCPYASREALEKDLLWLISGNSGIDRPPTSSTGAWVPGAIAGGALTELGDEPSTEQPESEPLPEPELVAPVAPEPPLAPVHSTAKDLHYLDCATYPKGDRFVPFEYKENGLFYFAFNDAGGNTFLRSRGFETEHQRDAAIQEVIRQASDQNNYATTHTPSGDYEYILESSSYKELARSCPYDKESDMLAALAWISGEASPIGTGSAMVGGILTSALALKGQETDGLGPALGAAAATTALAGTAAAIPAATTVPSSTPEREAKTPPPPPPPIVQKSSSSSGFPGWLWPLLLVLLLLALLAILFWKGCFDFNQKPDKPVDKPKVEQPALLGPTGTELDLTPGTTAYELADFLSDPTAEAPEDFRLDQLTFEDNSAEIPRAAQDQLQNLAVVLKAYPFARFGILGHTASSEAADDATIDATILGNDRANAVYKALIALGVSEAQLIETTAGSEDAPSASLRVLKKVKLRGPDGSELGLQKGTIEYGLADYLSDPDATGPGNFTPEGLFFRKNGVRLPANSKEQMQNIARVLMAYPDARFEILGNTEDVERPNFQGSKELSLGEARANAVYQILVDMGVSESQLSNGGEGRDNARSFTIRVIKK